jgi:hypothetical protein
MKKEMELSYAEMSRENLRERLYGCIIGIYGEMFREGASNGMGHFPMLYPKFNREPYTMTNMLYEYCKKNFAQAFKKYQKDIDFALSELNKYPEFLNDTELTGYSVLWESAQRLELAGEKVLSR